MHFFSLSISPNHKETLEKDDDFFLWGGGTPKPPPWICHWDACICAPTLVVPADINEHYPRT